MHEAAHYIKLAHTPKRLKTANKRTGDVLECVCVGGRGVWLCLATTNPQGFMGRQAMRETEIWTKNNKHVILQTRDLRAVHYTERAEMILYRCS